MSPQRSIALQKASQAWPDLMPAVMHVDDFIPSAGADFLIDAAVGKHFNAVLQKRDEDQDSRVIARVVQALIGKRRERESMNRLADTVFGRENSFHRREPAR